MARLDESDPNWRLDEIEATRPTMPEEINSARIVLAVHRLMHLGGLNYKALEPLDKLPPLPQLLDAERAALLERELIPVAAAVFEARKLAATPNGRHHLVFGPDPLTTVLTDQQNTRRQCFAPALRRAASGAEGRCQGALRSCRAILNAGRSLDDEPFLISQLIRIACISIACDAVERTLALGEPPPGDLAHLQELLEMEEKHPTLVVGLRGERAVMHAVFTGLSDGSISATSLAATVSGGAPSSWEVMLTGWSYKSMAGREHPHMLELMGRMIDNARLPPHEQAAAEKLVDAEVKSLSGGALTRQLVPAVNKVAEATRRKLAYVRCLKTLVAVERHRQATEAWPARLEELTPKLIASVPLDPYDGKPLRYRRVKDGVIVYSVGPDGKDNGGNLHNDRPMDPDIDMGYRLWDVKERRKPAKPPALPGAGGRP